MTISLCDAWYPVVSLQHEVGLLPRLRVHSLTDGSDYNVSNMSCWLGQCTSKTQIFDWSAVGVVSVKLALPLACEVDMHKQLVEAEQRLAG